MRQREKGFMSKRKPTATATMLQAWRSREQITQEAAAARLRAPFASYRNWEAGRTEPSRALRAAIALVCEKGEQ